MSGIVFSIQSLNNNWMMSIRKCWIGDIRWCFFFKNQSVIFPASIFFHQYRWIMFFCRGWLMLFLAKQMKTCRCRPQHNFGWARTKKRSRPTLSIFTAKPNKKDSSPIKKILSASVCKQNCTMSAEKYQSRLYNDRCRLLSFLFNPWIIFGWCLLGKVRSASSGDDSFLNIDRSSFLADVG